MCCVVVAHHVCTLSMLQISECCNNCGVVLTVVLLLYQHNNVLRLCWMLDVVLTVVLTVVLCCKNCCASCSCCWMLCIMLHIVLGVVLDVVLHVQIFILSMLLVLYMLC